MNIGIIGSGNIARTVIKALEKLNDINISGIYSRNIENAGQLSRQFDIPFYTDSIEKLCQRTDIDVIYIATPHIFHFEHCKRALSYHKNVICEKPMTINAEDARELIHIAQTNQCFIGEAFWTCFNPVFQQIKVIKKNGLIGDFKSLISNIGGNGLATPRLVDRRLAGGALMDIGIYNINLMYEVFGTQFTQNTSTWIQGESGVDLQHNLVFTFDNQASASLSATIQAKTLNGAIISGTNGYILIDHVSECNKLEVYNNHRELIQVVAKEPNLTGYEYEFIKLKECLASGKLEFDEMPIERTLNILKLTDQIRQEWQLDFTSENT